MTTATPTINIPSVFDPLRYTDAVALVLANPATRHRLKQRIAEDAAVDPVVALADAELLVELAKTRLSQSLQQSLATSH
jgi:hypothetical protein